MKEKFVDHKFNTASLKLIEMANAILREYRGQGYRLSLRQLYYQLVARGYIENSIKDLIEQDTWEEVEASEGNMREELERFANEYENREE
jgi:hypothetical protein